jgi:hypothetical protein
MDHDHREWHALAAEEGVNPWDCPFDCYPDGPFDADDVPPAPYALIHRPSIDGRGDFNWADMYTYPVFSRVQARRYAATLAERTGRAVRVEVVREAA